MKARSDVSAVLVLAALAWCMGTAGGSNPRDLALATALVVGARLTSGSADAPGPIRRTPRVAPATVALLGLVAWMIGVGLTHGAPGPDILRLPWLVCLCVLAGDTARLSAVQRKTVLSALPALGALLAVIALGHSAADVLTTDLPPTMVRAEAPLGYPNALAAILLTTTLLTGRAAGTRSGPVGPAMLVVQLIALVATGSRMILLIGTVVAGWYALRGPRRWLRAMATGWSIVAVVVLVARFLSAPTERLHLWVGAVRAIAADPVTGRGPSPVLIDAGPVAVRPTTHAHNEVLQLAVEYGLVALLLTGAVLYLGLRSSGPHRPRDRTLLLVMTVHAVPALTDFTLRIPAVALLLATVTGIAWRPKPDRAPRVIVPRRDQPGSVLS